VTYRIYLHENGEPVEKATANNRDEAIATLMRLFRGRLQGLRPVHTGEPDYDLYDAFVDDGEHVVAIEWD
jgi:hypothetical protein